MEKIKTLIIGSGPAGYTAAIYAGRANLQPVLYSGMQPGGQLTITTEVENFPGYPNGVDGTQMMMDMKEQAARFGAEMRDGSIVKADFSSRPFHLTDERDNEIEAETVIIATGASAKYLGLADEEKYRGQGVSACGNNTLAVDWVGHIACCENTWNVGGGSTWHYFDEALLVEIYLSLEEVGVRLMSDSQEESVDADVKLLFVGFALVAHEMSTFYTVLAEEPQRIGFEQNLDVLLVLYTLLHDF